MRAPSVYIDPHQLLSALHFHASSGVLFVFQGTGWCENWPKVRFTSSLIDPNMGQKISWDIYAAILRSSLTHTNRLANGIYKPSVSACERSKLRSIADVHIGETPESRVSFRKCQADSLVVRLFWKLGKQRQRSVYYTISAKKCKSKLGFSLKRVIKALALPTPSRLTKLACETRSAACRSLAENQCSSKVV